MKEKEKEKSNVEEEGLFSLEKPYSNITKEELVEKLDKKDESKIEISHLKKDELLFVANELKLETKKNDSKVKIINSIKKTKTPIEIINTLVKKFSEEKLNASSNESQNFLDSKNKKEENKIIVESCEREENKEESIVETLKTPTKTIEEKKQDKTTEDFVEVAKSEESTLFNSLTDEVKEEKSTEEKEERKTHSLPKKQEFEYAFMIADLSETIEDGDGIYSLEPPIFNEDNTVTLLNSFKQGVMSERILNQKTIVGKYKEFLGQTKFYLEAGILIKVVPSKKWMHLEESRVRTVFEKQLLEKFREVNKTMFVPKTTTPVLKEDNVSNNLSKPNNVNNPKESFRERFLKYQKQ